LTSYDASQRLIATERFNANTFRSWFDECQSGNTRIAPRSTACATLCGSLGGRTAGFVILLFNGSDDNGNPAVFNSDALRLGATSSAESGDGPFEAVSYSKAVRQ
jgi:hypothetical protein